VPALLSIPDLEWRNGALFSRAHDDCYTPALATPASDGHADAFAATRDFRTTRRHLTAELGFGTGLSFIAAWAYFRAHAPADALLD